MFFKQRINDDASISYFFGCGGQGKGIALDVLAGDEAWYVSATASVYWCRTAAALKRHGLS